MSATQLSCPQCGAILNSSRPLVAGTRVQCRKCSNKFHVPPRVFTASAPAAPGVFDFHQPELALSGATVNDPVTPAPDLGALAFAPDPFAQEPTGPRGTGQPSPGCGPQPVAINTRVLGLALAGALLLLALTVVLTVCCLADDGDDNAPDTGRKNLPLARVPDVQAPVLPEQQLAVAKAPAVENRTVAEKPAPVENRPAVNKPTAEKPAVNKPSADKPTVVVNKPAIEKPVVVPKKPEEMPVVPRNGIQRVGRHWVTAAVPGPLSKNVRTGLAWLVAKQNKDGGWDQGGMGQFAMRFPQAQQGTSTVAETCMAALALLRSGSSPQEGAHAQRLRRAIAFVCARVEKADANALSLSGTGMARFQPAVRGGFGGPRGFAATTLVQMKIGPAVDTFLAALLLAEVKDRMPDDRTEKRVSAALDALIARLEKHQGADGTWSQQGASWAPVLGQALAVKGINRARQAGVRVTPLVLDRAKKYAEKNFNARTGQFSVDASAAGIALYSAAGNLAALQDSVNTFKALEKGLRHSAANAADAERESAATQLQAYETTRKTRHEASRVVINNLSNARFLAGFGNNGGEEFLSYLNISEALAVMGGPEWDRWNRSMSSNLNRIQNRDGSWSGHHCITGQSFCTASALLVLLADRTPVPLAALAKQ